MNHQHVNKLNKSVEEWNKWRKKSEEKPDLGGANFNGANFNGADLSSADLRTAYLAEADLGDANLRDANLRGANLRGTKLRGANLKGADLRGAFLKGCALTDANLLGANFRDASLKGAKFSGANLTSIKLDLSSISNISDAAQQQYSASWKIQGLDALQSSVKPQIQRSIEFPPKYKTAGTAILAHFGEVLQAKYEDLAVKVTISQEKDTVSMIVETEDGDQLEKIEKAFEEYGLVIVGKKLPEEFLNNPLQVMDLKNKLQMIRTELDMKNRLLEHQKADISGLRALVAQVAKPTQVYFNVDNSSTSTATVNQTFPLNLNATRGAVHELASDLPEGDERARVEGVAKALDQVDKDSKPEDAAGNPALSKLRHLVEDLGDDKSRLGKTVKGLRSGTKIAQDIARRYNSIADWCGLPVVPSPLLGKKDKGK